MPLNVSCGRGQPELQPVAEAVFGGSSKAERGMAVVKGARGEELPGHSSAQKRRQSTRVVLGKRNDKATFFYL